MTRPAQPTLFDCHLSSPTTEKLVSLAVATGARTVPGLSDAERVLTRDLVPVDTIEITETIEQIQAGRDPLGELFCTLRSAEERRLNGATYTPLKIVDWMLRKSADRADEPARVVDAGVGSARFLGRAGKVFPKATLIGVEVDPLAALIARANLSILGLANRSKVILSDYRNAKLGNVAGKTLYIGNPPYVRHHQIEPDWKTWLAEKASGLGLDASQLAGLHVHFFLSTALRASPGDFGAFITAAEWLDVNYGKLVRDLVMGPLGGKRIDVIEPTAMPFPNAASTAAITFFEVGAKPRHLTLRRVETIQALNDATKERIVRRERLESEARWSHLTRSAGKKAPKGYIELGELCRVHRGQVTGANKFWIAGEHSRDLPESVLFPTVTKARELIRAGKLLASTTGLRDVIDLPHELDGFDDDERKAINRFLNQARRFGVPEGYIASTRRKWWSVGLRKPAPILATYMARRPPAFVLNKADARHINIAHGLYPREEFSEKLLTCLVDFLSHSVKVSQGRTYAGGLTKFEPREMERLLVPEPSILQGTNA